MKTVKDFLEYVKRYPKEQDFRIILQDDISGGLPYEVSHFSISGQKRIVYIHFKACSML